MVSETDKIRNGIQVEINNTKKNMTLLWERLNNISDNGCTTGKMRDRLIGSIMNNLEKKYDSSFKIVDEKLKSIDDKVKKNNDNNEKRLGIMDRKIEYSQKKLDGLTKDIYKAVGLAGGIILAVITILRFAV